jgi:hypothetical protein
MGMPGMGPMMMPRGGGPVSMVVQDGAVFVLRGDSLYRFNAETLELEAQYTFEPDAMGMPMGGPMGPGAGGREDAPPKE